MKDSMSQPPKTPPTTSPKTFEELAGDVQSLDAMTPEQLAAALETLAEKVIGAPLEYELAFGLKQLDAKLLDGIDLSTAEGRKKLAAILHLLASQVISRSKEHYLGGVGNDLKPESGKGRGR